MVHESLDHEVCLTRESYACVKEDINNQCENNTGSCSHYGSDTHHSDSHDSVFVGSYHSEDIETRSGSECIPPRDTLPFSLLLDTTYLVKASKGHTAVLQLKQYKRVSGIGAYFPKLTADQRRFLIREHAPRIGRADLVGLLCDVLTNGKEGSERALIHSDIQRELARQIAQLLDRYELSLILERLESLQVVPQSLFGVMANAKKRASADAVVKQHEERKSRGTVLPAEMLSEVVAAMSAGAAS